MRFFEQNYTLFVIRILNSKKVKAFFHDHPPLEPSSVCHMFIEMTLDHVLNLHVLKLEPFPKVFLDIKHCKSLKFLYCFEYFVNVPIWFVLMHVSTSMFDIYYEYVKHTP